MLGLHRYAWVANVCLGAATACGHGLRPRLAATACGHGLRPRLAWQRLALHTACVATDCGHGLPGNGLRPHAAWVAHIPAAKRRNSLAQRVSAGKRALPTQSSGGAASTEHVFFLERNPGFPQQIPEFLLKISLFMMLGLIADVSLDIANPRRAHAERAVSLLPCKPDSLFIQPSRRIGLQIAYDLRQI